ncbi:MAG: hypothetical protein ACRDQ5_07945 [Sciscionella sp.]
MPGVPQVLSATAFALSRKYPRYGALRFPRFIVGQLVMGLELDLTDHVRARQQVVEALKTHRGLDAVQKMLRAAAADLLQSVTRAVGLQLRPSAVGPGAVRHHLDRHGRHRAGREQCAVGRAPILAAGRPPQEDPQDLRAPGPTWARDTL